MTVRAGVRRDGAAQGLERGAPRRHTFCVGTPSNRGREEGGVGRGRGAGSPPENARSAQAMSGYLNGCYVLHAVVLDRERESGGGGTGETKLDRQRMATFAGRKRIFGGARVQFGAMVLTWDSCIAWSQNFYKPCAPPSSRDTVLKFVDLIHPPLSLTRNPSGTQSKADPLVTYSTPPFRMNGALESDQMLASGQVERTSI